MNCHGRRFRPVTNAPNGEVNGESFFGNSGNVVAESAVGG
jgi:hypothetical protein